MATEVFCWGYTAWRTRRVGGYEVSGFIDGRECTVVSESAEAAESIFCRAARRAWLRRKVRVVLGLPGRTTLRVSSAASYYPVSLLLISRVASREVGRATFRWLRH